MNPEKIVTYLCEQIKVGKTKQQLFEELSAVGWSEDECSGAYIQALIKNGVPTPEEKQRATFSKKSSTVEVVLNFFSFILLGVIATALGMLFFSIIERFFPEQISLYNEYSYRNLASTIHYATAAILIGFPLYVMTVRLWFAKFREEEQKAESDFTKWVTYLVLLIASVVIVGDLIAVVFTFLQGELSIRFLLKGVTILSIAGAIFGFYFLERKKIQYRKEVSRNVFQYFGWGLLGVIVFGITLGFMATGSPAVERKRSLDAQRSENLSTLASCAADFAEQFERLPSTLSEFEQVSMLSHCAGIYDPETGKEYEYTVTKPLQKKGTLRTGEVRLCANFALSSSKVEDGGYMDMTTTKWYNHDEGDVCFTETISVKTSVTVDPIIEGETIPEENPAIDF